ncbi:hypothetical protein [Dactylosporangium sp. NPDC051484]|uniref:hypothetical protein n=1 Tax=Dactylosporangium sp. NPDC051484 TaxID=3154942 RepID=UPI00344C5B12
METSQEAAFAAFITERRRDRPVLGSHLPAGRPADDHSTATSGVARDPGSTGLADSWVVTGTRTQVLVTAITEIGIPGASEWISLGPPGL